MPLVTVFANNLLKLLFNATPFANVADNAVTAPLTNLYVGAHTADPGVVGDQTTSETTYTGYVRQAIARTTGGFTCTGAALAFVANVVFPISTAGVPVITHFSIGSAASAAGTRWLNGTVTPNITVSTVVVQTLTNGSTPLTFS